MTESLEQRALRIDAQLCGEGKVATSAAYAIEFARRLTAEQQGDMVVVPRKLTDEMRAAGYKRYVELSSAQGYMAWQNILDCVNAMLAAAPPHPSQEPPAAAEGTQNAAGQEQLSEAHPTCTGATEPVPAAPDATPETDAIPLLLRVTRAAYEAVDNGESRTGGEHILFEPWVNELDAALNALDELPELPEPYVGNGPSKAEYVIHRQRNALRAKLAQAEQDGKDAKRHRWLRHNIVSGVKTYDHGYLTYDKEEELDVIIDTILTISMEER